MSDADVLQTILPWLTPEDWSRSEDMRKLALVIGDCVDKLPGVDRAAAFELATWAAVAASRARLDSSKQLDRLRQRMRDIGRGLQAQAKQDEWLLPVVEEFKAAKLSNPSITFSSFARANAERFGVGEDHLRRELRKRVQTERKTALT